MSKCFFALHILCIGIFLVLVKQGNRRHYFISKFPIFFPHTSDSDCRVGTSSKSNLPYYCLLSLVFSTAGFDNAISFNDPAQAEVNDIAVGAAGAGGEDDNANWHRMQSRRKARGLSFLRDKYSAFHLLATLALATLLSRITNLCFRFANSDRKGIPRKEEERAKKRRRRMNAKGREAFVEAEDNLHFDRVKCQAEKSAKLLWQELQGPLHYLVCADCFWPASEPVQLKWEFLTENILRNVAALRWRILVKFEFPPWSLAHVALPGCSDEEVPWHPM